MTMSQEQEADKTNAEVETASTADRPGAGVEGRVSFERMLSKEEIADLRELAEQLNETYREITKRLRGLDAANDDSFSESPKIESERESENKSKEADVREETQEEPREITPEPATESNSVARSRPEPQFTPPTAPSAEETVLAQSKQQQEQDVPRRATVASPAEEGAAAGKPEMPEHNTEAAAEGITYEIIQNLLSQANEQFDTRNMLHMMQEYGNDLKDFLNAREAIEELTKEDSTERMKKLASAFIAAAKKIDVTIDQEKAASGESTDKTPTPDAEPAVEEPSTESPIPDSEEQPEEGTPSVPKREVPAVGRGVAAAVGVTGASSAETNANEKGSAPLSEDAVKTPETPEIPDGSIDVRNQQSVESVGETEGVFENTDVPREEIVKRAQELMREQRASEVQKQAA